jgi:tetratricopeptide (TPR) repeat protein
VLKGLRVGSPEISNSGYSVREAADLLGISAAEVRRCVRAGLLASTATENVRLNFQDLVLLRRAASLMSSRVAPHRVRKALRRLRGLADGRPLSGIELVADGRHLIARSEGARWNVESSQLLFDFEIATPRGEVAVLRPRARIEDGRNADEWYALGCEAEDTNIHAAAVFYDRALRLEPLHPDALLNRGRLFHSQAKFFEAERCFRQASTSERIQGLALFNLGVTLEDQGRIREALEAYESAVKFPDSASDAHFNAARLYERTGQRARALAHLRSYRALLRG